MTDYDKTHTKSFHSSSLGKRSAHWCTVALVVLLLPECGTQGQKIMDGQWRAYQVPDARFQVSFPQAPLRDSIALPTRLGDVLNYKLSATSDDAGFSVSWSTHPDSLTPPESLEVVGWSRLNGARQSITAYAGEVVFEDTVPCDGYLGYEMVTIGSFEGQQIYSLLRLFLVGSRFYQLTMLSTDSEYKKDEMVAFFGSFKIDQLSAPPPPSHVWDEVFKK